MVVVWKQKDTGIEKPTLLAVFKTIYIDSVPRKMLYLAWLVIVSILAYLCDQLRGYTA